MASDPMSTTPTLRDAAQALKPCPWCGAGETMLHVNKGTWNGQRYGEPVSVEVRHWCEPEDGQPARMVARVGRDEASAIAAWNTRAALTQGAGEAVEPVAEIVLFGRDPDLKEVAWRKGRMPKVGTKMYDAQQLQQAVARAREELRADLTAALPQIMRDAIGHPDLIGTGGVRLTELIDKAMDAAIRAKGTQ